MLDDTRAWLVGQIKSARPAFASKNPHFNFITVHYFWIVGATIISSIAIFIGGKDRVSYTDSLMFGSGANTQAGLNPIDVNNLNGFQQAMIYLFVLLSNPITIHTSVVFLRLYWFEKRFRDLARDARLRRRSLSKSRSQARADLNQIERQIGVGDRRITVVPSNGASQRLTHDGIVLNGQFDMHRRPTGSAGNESDTTMTDEIDPMDKPFERAAHQGEAEPNEEESLALSSNGNGINGKKVQGEGEEEDEDDDGKDGHGESQEAGQNEQGPAGITFANTVKRSDGMGSDATKFPQDSTNAGHIAILERQRNQDNEILRIPGPRDTERGLGPRRLLEGDQDEDDRPVGPDATSPTRFNDPTRIRSRNPTITIEEPRRHLMDDFEEDAQAVGGVMSSLRLRKPRIFQQDQNKVHEEPDSRDRRPRRSMTMGSIRSALTRDKSEDMPYLSYTPTIGRNSNFVGLTLEQRDELGGIEYRSLRTLALVLLFYFWVYHLIAVVCLLPYILHNNRYGRVLDTDRIGRVWWSFWTANMAFMDVGFSLTPDSMSSFATSKWVLLVMWFFIIIGNTGFPVMLRFMIWVFSKIVPKGSGLWEEFMFLLDHPRRCFTLLFPSNATWWLFWILVLLNVIDLVFFVVLDLGSEPVHRLALSDRVVIGLFQAASTRTAGFSATNLADLHPAMSVLYMIMMYISVFPIAISIRRTNVYEEQSLGVYPDAVVGSSDDAPAISYVGTHLRRQLSFDLWYVFLGFFILAIAEGGKIMRGRFDLFAILFEIVSAYGTVGMSIGVPDVNASLSSQFSVVGKLIIVAMQIRGRHRALPYGLDRAILLPSEMRFKKEAEEANNALMMRSQQTALPPPVVSGAQRPGSSLSHKRRGSRDQNPASLITSFLHPGPPIQGDVSPTRSRVTSSALASASVAAGGSHRRARSVADIRQGPRLGPLRTQTVPHTNSTGSDHHDTSSMEPLAPLRSLQAARPPSKTDSSPAI